MYKKRYFKNTKSYFNFINRYKDVYKIINVYLTKKNLVVVYNERGEL